MLIITDEIVTTGDVCIDAVSMCIDFRVYLVSVSILTPVDFGKYKTQQGETYGVGVFFISGFVYYLSRYYEKPKKTEH